MSKNKQTCNILCEHTRQLFFKSTVILGEFRLIGTLFAIKMIKKSFQLPDALLAQDVAGLDCFFFFFQPLLESHVIAPSNCYLFISTI